MLKFPNIGLAKQRYDVKLVQQALKATLLPSSAQRRFSSSQNPQKAKKATLSSKQGGVKEEIRNLEKAIQELVERGQLEEAEGFLGKADSLIQKNLKTDQA